VDEPAVSAGKSYGGRCREVSTSAGRFWLLGRCAASTWAASASELIAVLGYLPRPGHVHSSAAGGAALPVPKGEKPTQGERSNLFAAGSTIATSIVAQVRWFIAETSLTRCQWLANLRLRSRTSSIFYHWHLLRSYSGSSPVLVASSVCSLTPPKRSPTNSPRCLPRYGNKTLKL
jgi:hypothetical protein